MRLIVLCLLLFHCSFLKAQELYVFSEPASARPAKSIAFNMTARFPNNRYNNFYYNRYVPQVVIGASKKLMFNAGAAFSNYYRLDKLQLDGARIYGKYRFFSQDDVHQHLRLAVFAEAGLTKNEYLYDEMTLQGDNNGVQVGLIATQLVNKIAVSGSTSYLRIFTGNDKEHHSVLNHSLQMLGYSISAGYLLLPKEYVDYKQLNVNLYLELLGSKCLDTNLFMADLAPAVQLIFNSNTKVNLGARFQMAGNMKRVGQRSIEVGIEKTILNFWN